MSSSGENKRKLDELLGLAASLDEQSVKSAGNSLGGMAAEASKTLTPAGVSNQMPSTPAVRTTDTALEVADENASAETQRNLGRIDELIDTAKQVMDHVYSVVTSSDLLDPQIVNAAAKLISETRSLIDTHLEIQKNQRDFLNQLQFEELRHRHQLELMEKKFELEKRKYEAKNPPLGANGKISQAPSSGAEKLKSYTSADMMRMIDEGS